MTSGIWSNVVKIFGLARKTEASAAEKHAAVIKIQRAWRNHIRFESAMSIDGDDEFDEMDAMMEESGTGRSDQSSRKERFRTSSPSFSRSRARGNTRMIGRQSIALESRFHSQAGKGRESQVGSDMRELTGQRVAIGTLLALICSVLFTYTEASTTLPSTMVVLHKQTMFSAYQTVALEAAVNTTLPELYMYQPVDGSTIEISDGSDLRNRDKLVITVSGTTGTSIGWFNYSAATQQSALVDIVATLFIIAFWFFGVTAFSGPVMLLVITPIERMVRLLGMLMMDPLGYQSTARFQRFMHEEDDIIENTCWTKEVLKGMETSFLMSTILRIGSLMRVGFGSAGVEIIRNNLQKGQSKNSVILNSQGSTVSCIFLFCDIRQFTDATECLQEEVFVFTNRIAAVVHSICHSYGGAANKNIGDAFLLSWSLEEDQSRNSTYLKPSQSDAAIKAKATSNQADKALLSVIKICISLWYNKFYLEPLTEAAQGRLKAKLKNRQGPVVQMGFGLHAGKAVQGAIGSPRKIDATYVSEAVVSVEFLEASTKKYDLQMLMSGSFHALLHPSTKRRCRMVDKVFIVDEDEDADEDDDELHGERMDIYTYDMDIAAIHRPRSMKKTGELDTLSDGGSMSGEARMNRTSKRLQRRSHGSERQLRNRRRSTAFFPAGNNPLSGSLSEDFAMNTLNTAIENGNFSHSTGQASVSSIQSDENNPGFQGPPELVLPTGPALYSHNVWQNPEMKRIRDKFVQGLFFQKFNEGLTAYYKKDWESAKNCFQCVLEQFDDGPSKYFLAQMKMHGWVPPRDFREYGVV
jgi:class 3 adenylate cyclase